MKKSNKILFIIAYWFLSLTWGIIMSLIGLISVPFLLLLEGKAHKNGCGIIIEIEGNWGGINLGPVSICGNYSKDSHEFFEKTRRHEFGHSIQNIILGPLHILLVAIPSVIRYFLFIYREKMGIKNPEYDAVIFEGTATKLGTYWINKLESKYIPPQPKDDSLFIDLNKK